MNAIAARIGLLLAGVLGLAASSLADDPAPRGPEFAGWPQTWVDAYRRFDDFAASRRESWPRSGLEIGEGGSITHSVRIFNSRTEHLTLNIFRRGRNFLGTLDNGQLFGEGRPELLTPGQYAACLWASTEMGYQYVYPILWFDITDAPDQRQGAAPQRRVKMIARPVVGDEMWPNERQLLYLDFQIFPHGHPWDIERANQKVKPDVVLQLDIHGSVQRDLLADETAEKLLRWRIYRNGKLVDKTSATSIAQKDTDFGPGTYSTWLGVEGPNGFMPVSNLLHYPLFPDASGKDVVIPSETHKKGIPDFLETLSGRALARGNSEQRGAAPSNDGTPKAQESSPALSEPRDSSEATQRQLFELWDSWKFDLNYRPPIPRKPE